MDSPIFKTMLKPVHPLQLYAYLLRKTRELPPHVQNYYRHHIRQFNSHLDEEDPRRISEIINKAVDDMEWLIRKMTC
ncbi:hypothetical protein EG68_06237 [Paragonimus skrjabini miyazakii]|uniref:LYR motif-containing protein 9 n=1 Tax=Paragonimus skrjabini miyazakii TaxID=59628 RepID=A0A8S9YTQ6_9TREM|nr:hypothetical protein EG68_06237 [Paragonimus skrjabini miyazakii]